jgi:outer membrane protein OmpA-like peptidoglycan-associated protein
MRIRSSIALGAALTLTACAINPKTGQPELASSVKDGLNSTFNSDDPCANNDRNIGLVLGTVTGVAVGYLAHGVKGAVVGGAVGAAGGYLIGHALDSRRCELSKIAAANGLKLISAPITQPNDTVSASGAKPANNSGTELGLDVQVQNKGDEFAPGTAELTPQGRAYMGQIAAQYSPKILLASLPADATPAQRAQALSRKVMIVGHTDEHDAMTGTDLATLSQERAKTVAKLFVDQGVPAENIYYQGAGDTLPIASNATSDGREANQRTQIVDVPTELDLQKFLAQRTANPANYRFASKPAGSAAGGMPRAASAVTLSKASPSSAPSALASGSRSAASATTAATAPSAQTAESATEQSVSQVASLLPATSAPSTPPAKASKQAPRANQGDAFDFGGIPTNGAGIPVSLGSAPKSSFSLISNANATDTMHLDSCLGDHPHNASDVRNLATDQVLSVRDYMPGFFGAPWAASLGGNLVTLLDVRVPSDAGSPIPEPQLQIYKDYRGNAKQKANYSSRVPVNVYRGSDATLYRVFVKGPMQCLDLVVPNSKPRATGNVYYTNRAVDYTASSDFVLR